MERLFGYVIVFVKILNGKFYLQEKKWHKIN